MNTQPQINTPVPVLATVTPASNTQPSLASDTPILATVAPITDTTTTIADVVSPADTESCHNVHKAKQVESDSSPSDDAAAALHDLKKFLNIIESPLLQHCNICDEAVTTDKITLKPYNAALWHKFVPSVILVEPHNQSSLLRMNHNKFVIDALHWRPESLTTPRYGINSCLRSSLLNPTTKVRSLRMNHNSDVARKFVIIDALHWRPHFRTKSPNLRRHQWPPMARQELAPRACSALWIIIHLSSIPPEYGPATAPYLEVGIRLEVSLARAGSETGTGVGHARALNCAYLE